MITYRFPVIIKGRWTQAVHTCNKGNKYEALQEYIAARKAEGVIVQGHDMSQCWKVWN